MSPSILFSEPITNLAPSFRAESELSANEFHLNNNNNNDNNKRNSSQVRLRLFYSWVKSQQKLSTNSLCRRYYKFANTTQFNERVRKPYDT